MASPAERLRALLARPGIRLMPCCFDALSARLVERAGFELTFMSGFAVSATRLALPDTGLASYGEMVEQAREIAAAVSIPVIGDGDTGYGNAVNAKRTVRGYARAGFACVMIEDQVAPKRCGHMAGKAVIPAEEMVGKVKAALDARVDPDLVIMARTDALTVSGIDDAIERAQLYREAGADLIFVESPRSVAEMRRICREIDAPLLANNVEAGLSPVLPAAELQEIGYAAVAFPVAATYAVARAVGELMATLRRDGTTAAYRRRMLSFDEFNALVGLPALRRSEADKQDFARELMERAGLSRKRATGTAGRKRRK